MKKRIKTRVMSGILLLACMLWFGPGAGKVNAAEYVMTGAYEGGNVVIEEIGDATQVNGYSKLGGYRVTYTVTNNSWVAFDEQFGGYFYIGNNLSVGGGCPFGYHQGDGRIWEEGKIVLGNLSDGVQVSRCDATSNTVSCSFVVSDLSQLPDYIAYAYQPASGAYLHLANELGAQAHVWYYHSLKGVGVTGNSAIDVTGPTLNTEVAATGKTVTVSGKTWGTTACIRATAEDTQARPQGIQFYQNGTLLEEISNPDNGTRMSAEYTVRQNGTIQVQSYDKLYNITPYTDVKVDCIDNTAPVIKNLTAETGKICKTNKITADSYDDGCGLAALAYSWNGGAWTSENSYCAEKNGTYTLKVRDALGNESSKSIEISNIDNEAPVIECHWEHTGKVVLKDGAQWSTKVHLKISVTDEGAGVREVKLCSDDGTVIQCVKGDENSKETNVILENEELGQGKYRIIASDWLGNQATNSNLAVKNVDNEPPVIEKVFVEKTGEQFRLVVTAQDNEDGAGLPLHPYSFDGGKTWQEEPYIEIEENGLYTVLVKDCLEQISSADLEVDCIPDKSKETDENTDKLPDDNTDKLPGEDTDKYPNETEETFPNENETILPDENEDGTSKDNTDNLPDADTETVPAGNTDATSGDSGSAVTQPTASYPSRIKITQKVPKRNPSERASVSDDSTNDGTNEDILKKIRPQIKDTSSATTVVPEDNLRQLPEQEVESVQSSAAETTDPVQKTLLAVLLLLFGAGLVGLGLYLLLSWLRYSCIVYGIEENHKKTKLCRLPIKQWEDDWQVRVPDGKLGTHGTGNYLLVFHPSFIKEETPGFLLISIDGKTLREKLAEEVQIHI
jgi:hypothetical protein